MNRILYLHGFASGPTSSKARYFRQLLEQAGAHVDVPDLAAGDFEHLTISGQLALIEQIAAGNPVDLVGSSLGGYLAALYAAHHPEVRRLVLLAPAFGFAQRWPQRVGPVAMADWKRTGAIDVFHYADNRNRKLGYQFLTDAEPYPANPDFHQPALIFHGRHDDVVPVTYSEEFSASHPNAHLEVVDSGHDLLNVLASIAPKILQSLSE
jgi:pimeloyl-ACP methyl ester carboxylesterase